MSRLLQAHRRGRIARPRPVFPARLAWLRSRRVQRTPRATAIREPTRRRSKLIAKLKLNQIVHCGIERIRDPAQGNDARVQAAGFELPQVALARLDHERELPLGVSGLDAPLFYPPAESLLAVGDAFHDVKIRHEPLPVTSWMVYGDRRP